MTIQVDDLFGAPVVREVSTQSSKLRAQKRFPIVATTALPVLFGAVLLVCYWFAPPSTWLANWVVAVGAAVGVSAVAFVASLAGDKWVLPTVAVVAVVLPVLGCLVLPSGICAWVTIRWLKNKNGVC